MTSLSLKSENPGYKSYFTGFFFTSSAKQPVLPLLVKKQNQYPSRVNQLTIHYMYAFLTDNAVLVSHFSCQLFLGKTIKERKAGKDKETERFTKVVK